jgi:hypothetical protein
LAAQQDISWERRRAFSLPVKKAKGAGRKQERGGFQEKKPSPLLLLRRERRGEERQKLRSPSLNLNPPRRSPCLRKV